MQNCKYSICAKMQKLCKFKRKKMPQKSEKLLIIKLFERTEAFLLIYLLLLLFFYGLGNYQHFLDTTILLILKITSYISVILALVAFIKLILACTFCLAKKTFLYLPAVFLSIFAITFAIILLLFSAGINLLSTGPSL